MAKQNKPAIRFKGFTDAWEQRKLGALCVEFKSGDFISASDIAENEAYPVYGGNGLRGFTNHYNHDGEYALIGRQGALCGNVNYAVGKSYFTEHAVAVRANKTNQTRFLYYLFSTMNLGQYSGQSAQPGLAVGNLVELENVVPSKPEQEKIASFLSSLDNLITLHQRKYDKLQVLKKAMLEKMFPKNGSSVPEIRFKGFTDAWEQRKVGDLLIERNQQAPMSDEYPLMAFIANEGVAPKGERYDRSALVTDTVNKLYKKTEKGDFIYSSNNLETGSIGLNKYGKACISPVYSIFEPTGIADSDFLGRRLVRKDFINTMVKWRQGVIYGQWRIHESDFLKIEIAVPSVEEQRKIGTYLDQLDNLITLHQRELEKLQNIKKSMLEKMFA
ncbi:MAG: restriction endonuclease subunit S [Bifidobacterium longum]|nr:restriction endonuclease subunit S [Bifidobacterium longum]